MKKIVLCVFSVFVLAIASNANAEMLGYWDFEEGAGVIVEDESGNGNTGHLLNVDDSNWIPGVLDGTGLYFNGDSQMIEFDTSPEIHNLNGPMTAETWFRGTEGDNPGHTILFDKSHAQEDYTGWVLQFAAWENRPLIFSISDGSDYTWALAPNVLDGTWHHVAGTYDGSSICIYIDGELIDTVVYSGTHATNSRSLEIAGWGLAQGRFFKGDIDETALFDEALSQDVIRAHYQNGITTGPNNDPLAHAGTDITAGAGDVVYLDGSASYDPDGDLLSYEWTVISDPDNTVICQEKSCETIAHGYAEEIIQLKVVDSNGASSTDTMLITNSAVGVTSAEIAEMQAEIAALQKQVDKLIGDSTKPKKPKDRIRRIKRRR